MKSGIKSVASFNVGPVRPTPRPRIYDLYWQFASRRQAVFEKRRSGAPGPWTDDEILQVYKFCNVYRAADRVSQYLIRHVAYTDETVGPADRLFQIIAFRTFSSIDTWEGVKEVLGHSPNLADLASGAFVRSLDVVKRRNGGLYTGAFILCANKAFGHDEKHHNHIALFKHMFLGHEFARHALGVNSLEAIVKYIESFPLMGPFMAYQIAIDLNYSELFDFGENDYTQAGPGAVRGLKKAFVDLGDFSPADTIRWMVDRQDAEFARLGLSFSGLFGRPLHAIDCQGLFCELDKYCREAAPQLLSNRSRIKRRFSPSRDLFALFFPPKWGLNVESQIASEQPQARRQAQYEFFPDAISQRRRRR